MKKIFGILTCIIFFTAFTCENEPLEGDFETNTVTNLTCAEATQNLATASTNYSNVTIGDANYATVCNAYTDALQDMLDVCGDTTGVVQALLDSLDCNSDPGTGTGVDYFPRAIGNSWTYNTFSDGEQTSELTNTETLDGFEYFAFNELLGVPSWLRKNGPNYYLRAEFSGSLPGYQFTSTPYTVILIKDDALVDETWQSDVSYTISYIPDTGLPAIPDADVEATYSFEMKERNVSRTVEGVIYNDVIHIELIVTAIGQVVTAQYYYANNIGMIDYITDAGSSTLLEYTIN